MKKENSKPLVSICCAAYNHEAYIEDALKGFLMQECDFEYEILIHDDASTDKTAEIIRAYERRYPDKIFPIYQTENQYSQGKKYSDLNYERVRGKYVAICEGDDYWTHPQKLAKQIKAMQEKPEFGLSFHKAKELNVEQNSTKEIGNYLNKDGIVAIEDIIIKTNGMIPTASTIITADVMRQVLEFKSTRPYLTVGDTYIHILGALKAQGAIYINDAMSIYRFMRSASWSTTWLTSPNKQIQHIDAIQKSFNDLDEITNHQYSSAFESSIIKKLFTLSFCTRLELIPNNFQNYKDKLQEVLNTLLLSNINYILYGASTSSKLILSILNHKVSYIVDNDRLKDGKNFEDKIIFTPDYLKNLKDENIIISLIMRSDDAYHLLTNHYGIDASRIIQLEDLLLEKLKNDSEK